MSEMIIYQDDSGTTNLEVKLENETLWLSQKQLSELFDVTTATINEHIKNIYYEKELEKDSTIRKFLIVQQEGTRNVKRDIEHYNLDMIISVGYRVKSNIATRFRQWATARIKEYIIKGFVMDDERLKQINFIYADMLDKNQFTQSFTNSAMLLAQQRTKEQNDVGVSQKLYGLPKP